jgi:hypothetical protein
MRPDVLKSVLGISYVMMSVFGRKLGVEQH